MSKLLQSCEMAGLHPRRGLRAAARRPDSVTDHLADRIDDGYRRQAALLAMAGLDLTITPANVLISSGTKQFGTAGETITAGCPIYLKSSDSKLWLSDADASAEAASAVGISLHAALAGQPLAYLGSNGDILAFGAILTVNVCYITSDTAGLIRPIADIDAGDWLQVLGFAITTSTLKLNMFTSGVQTA